MTHDALDAAADSGSQAATEILFVDNHPLFRATVGQYLRYGGDDKVHFVGIAATGDVLLMAVACRPQIILVDMSDPAGAGLELIRGLRRLLPDAAIVGMGWEDTAVTEQEARGAGADTVLLKDHLTTTLLPAVKDLTRMARAKRPGQKAEATH